MNFFIFPFRASFIYLEGALLIYTMKRKKEITHRPGTLARREMKRKVRSSPEWAELRETISKNQNNIDPVTCRPLLRGWNLHHLSQCSEFYDDLSEDRFVALNHRTHEIVHALYDVYKREQSWQFLDELKTIIEKMVEITKNDEKKITNYTGDEEI